MSVQRWEAAKEWGTKLAIPIVTLPIFYVLSMGPVAGWIHRRQINDTITPQQIKSVKRFYTPLIFAHDNCRPVGSALEWYVELWERN